MPVSMPMPTVSSPFGANDSFAPDSEMPFSNFNSEFEFYDAEDSTTPNPDFIDLHAGNPLHFADPKALIGNPPGQIGSTKVTSYSIPSHRGSSSSSSSPESIGSSPKTSQTSGDVMMADGHMTSWKFEDSAAHNDSSFNTLFDSMDPSSLDMSHVFDFDSASSSPSPPSNSAQSTLASPQFSASTAPRSPRTKRHKGHHKVQSVSRASLLINKRQSQLTVLKQKSLTKSMNGLKTSGSRDVSPASNPIASHESSPAAIFNSPSPDHNMNFFSNMSGLGVSAVWPQQVASLQTGGQVSQVNPNLTSIPQNHGLPSYIPQPSLSNAPRPRLFVQPTPLKSRVETQIPIKLTIHHLPPGIKRIHLPTHTISKPKLLSRPPAVRVPDMLELYTMLVCTSAMTDPVKRERAFARAAAAQHDYRGVKPVEEKPEDEDNKPQNGGEVRICSGCITRERKRAGRKKHKKPEEEELWNRFESQRVIVFNTQEVKEWQPVTPHMADPTGAGLRESVPEGTMQVDAPMRIACYCRHHGEKMGFQVIFTVKDYQDNVVAQQLSSSIMITDDHKTHLPATSTMQNSSNLNVAATIPQPTAPDVKPIATMPFQPPQSCELQNHGGNAAFTYPPVTSAQCTSVTATPRTMSRQPSPTLQPGQISRKRKASGSGKVPNGLAMTKIENQASSGLPNSLQSDSTAASATPSPFSPNLGTFPLTSEALFSHGGHSALGNIPPFATGPPTPNSNGAEQLIFPSNRTLSLDNLPPQLFSAPPTANPSRAPSPNQLREISQGLYNSNAGATPSRAPQPMIYKIIPGEGPKSGGVEVTILGSGFTNGGLEVMFGEHRATTTTFWGETSLVCLLPPSPIAGVVPVSIKHPSVPVQHVFSNNQQPLFRYVDDDEHRLIRTALTVLGNKLGGKITDVADIARNIIYGPAGSGGSWSSGSGNGQAPGSNNFNSHQQDSDVEAGLLRVLELIDLDDSPNKARINLRRSSGQTMLHLACSLGMVRFVAGLLSRGANVGIRDKGGFTALHMAAMNDYSEIVRRLIMKGADPTMRSLSGLTPADVARSNDVIRILRRIETHSRSRSGSSRHSRVSSASSLRSLWDPPSMTPVKRDEFLDESKGSDEESSEVDEGDSSADVDSEEEEQDYVKMMDRGRPRLEVSDARPAVPAGPVSPSAAMAAVRDHFAAQIQQFQHSMAMQFQNFPQLQVPQMLQMPQNMQTMLPDAQAYLNSPSVVQRISSLVPTIRGTGDQSATDNRWSFFGSKEAPPPAYEEIFPQKDLDTKQASAAQAAADFEADTKCTALFDQEEVTETEVAETSASGSKQVVPDMLHVGRKKAITREQQENLQRAHAASLKTGSSDKMLWFFWVPVLVFVLGAMLISVAPSLFSDAVRTVTSYCASDDMPSVPRQLLRRANERLLEIL
ncbi:SPT3 Dosage dependent suppressor of Ty-induced promoter mutations-like protein [Diatrype stigma]|uniref:SPT3 Dosage dependent suppressor of Ty-induced promoter mutations-like protein n=1 Tax=Diatrype stigma TaxID=117547 RepID=A0AAN9YM05_9PEZI